MATVDLQRVSVDKGEQRILIDIDLSVADGEMMAVIGASGSGKTTLLRAVAGLDDLVAGEVRVGGVQQRDPRMRDVAMVFQDNVLYPQRDAAGNIAFPLEVRRERPDEISRRVGAEARALHIVDLMERMPSELSAGHQQLVQIARAMVRAPAVFLLDEPLARLDPKLRSHMRGEVKLLQRGYGVTALYATNDPVEAMSVSDRMAVLEQGRLMQVGVPEEVYHHPVNLHVAQLLGELATVDVRVEPDPPGCWLAHPEFRVRAWASDLNDRAGGAVTIGFRPEYVELAENPDATVCVARLEHRGGSHVAWAPLGDTLVGIRLRHPTVRPGDNVPVRFARYLAFDPDTGRALAG